MFHRCLFAFGLVAAAATALAQPQGEVPATRYPSGPGGGPPARAYSPPPAGTNASLVPTLSSSPSLPVNGALVTNTVSLASWPDTYIWDVDVTVNVTHPDSGELSIYLRAPGGKRVTLTTGNGAGMSNVFAGTTFDDSEPTSATAAAYTSGVPASALSPEGNLSRLRSLDPNGTWTLEVEDAVGGSAGTLVSWSLAITTLDATPTLYGPFVQQSYTPKSIPQSGATGSGQTFDWVLTDEMGTQIAKVEFYAEIEHDDPSQLEIELLNNAVTYIRIAKEVPASDPDTFNGTLWHDAAPSIGSDDFPSSDYDFSSGPIPVPELAPEGSFDGFVGLDPNTTMWMLRVRDHVPGGTGTLVRWELRIWTYDDAQPPSSGFCTSGPTSSGCAAHLTSSGSPSAGNSGAFEIRADCVESQKTYTFFYGVSGPKLAPWGANDFLCVRSPTQRTGVGVTGMDIGSCGGSFECSGTMVLDWNDFIATNPGALGTPFVGDGSEEVYVQGWFRDPASAKTTHLTDALHFTVGP